MNTVTLTETQFAALTAAMSALSAVFTPVPSDLPLTSAAVATKPAQNAAKAVRPSAAKAAASVPAIAEFDVKDDTKICLTFPEKKTRRRIPARMFDAAGKCRINGELFIIDPSDDGGRSLKLNLKTVFGAEVGQSVVFTKVQKGKYTAELVGTAETPAPAVVPAPAAAAKPAKSKSLVETAAAVRPSRPGKAIEVPAPAAKPAKPAAKVISTVEEFLSHFEKLAMEGVAKGHDDSAKLEPIAGVDGDARMYLSTSQRIVFKGVRKSLGLNHKQSVEMLNSVVFAD